MRNEITEFISEHSCRYFVYFYVCLTLITYLVNVRYDVEADALDYTQLALHVTNESLKRSKFTQR